MFVRCEIRLWRRLQSFAKTDLTLRSSSLPFKKMRREIFHLNKDAAMIQCAHFGAPRVDSSSMLLEWRGAELRICSANAGDLSGLPFPKQEIQLLGFWLESHRNRDGTWVVCKHLLPAPEDGEDGVPSCFWRVNYRLLLGRDGIYKFQARKGSFVPDQVLMEHYFPVGQNGSRIWMLKGCA